MLKQGVLREKRELLKHVLCQGLSHHHDAPQIHVGFLKSVFELRKLGHRVNEDHYLLEIIERLDLFEDDLCRQLRHMGDSLEACFASHVDKVVQYEL